jgi:hypothetical protein
VRGPVFWHKERDLIVPAAFTDEHDLTDELCAEDVVVGRTSRESAFIDPDDSEYDWVPSL